MRILGIVGARPNFVKIASIRRALSKTGDRLILVHTGQHYDWEMSGSFFEELDLPDPDESLGVGSMERSAMVMRAMLGIRRTIQRERPDWVVVVGDVNSTLAGAMAASKEGVRLAHVEAGLRSGDERMAEEFNRKVTDVLSDVLFASCEDGAANLKAEGVAGEIHFVGNTMIDTLLWAKSKIDLRAEEFRKEQPYAVVSLHRPELVDDPDLLRQTMGMLGQLSTLIPLKFPVHPRTRNRLLEFGIDSKLQLLEPMPYLCYVAMMSRAQFVLTDSGGVQEETTFLGIPCLTLRETTERPVTIRVGTNRLVKLPEVLSTARQVLNGLHVKGRVPDKWDGHAGDRIVEILKAH